MTLITGTDASDPAEPLPGQVACGYIGGATPHVWTAEQWEMQTAEWLLPIWTADPNTDPVIQGIRINRLLGHYGLSHGDCYILDSELLTAGDKLFINKLADVTGARGHWCLPYDSVDRIFTFPHRHGYMVADWTDKKGLYPHADVVGDQYESNWRFDSDVFSSRLKFWRNPYVKHDA